MERVYTNYTASGRQVVLNNVPTSFAPITIENIRLIYNETQKNAKGQSIDPLVSTGVKENVTSVVYDGTANTVTITLASSVPEIESTDDLTIKIDMGEGIEDIPAPDLSTIAKESSVKDGNDTTIGMLKDGTNGLAAIKNAIPTVANIQNGLAKQGADSTVTLTGVDSTLGDVEAVLEYIEDGGLPDVSTLAKQGDNVYATNTAIYAEILATGSLYDQSVAAQLHNIIGDEYESSSES